MFSFFNSWQRQHDRTMSILNQITHDAADRMVQDAERSNRRAEHAREEMREESHSTLMKLNSKAQFLEGECERLIDELADYKNLANYWANTSELAQRMLNHMVEHWQPVDAPDEDLEARRARKKELREQMVEAVLADETWPARREERHQARIKHKQRRG